MREDPGHVEAAVGRAQDVLQQVHGLRLHRVQVL